MNARRIVVPLLTAILCAAAPALAQNADTSGAAAPKQTEARASVNFPGGTVAEYTAAVRRAFPGANIAVAPGVESVRLAPVELKSVNFNEAMFAIPTLSESPVSVDWFSTTALVDGAAATKRQGGNQSTHLKVWPMAEVLAQSKPEDALAAMQIALDLVGPGAEVKFHADSKLLMVKGTPDQIDAAAQVVDRLGTNANFQRAQDAAAHECAAKLEAATRRIDFLQEQVNRLEILAGGRE